MTAIIGSIAAKLVADAGGLDTGLRLGATKIERFEKSFAGSLARIDRRFSKVSGLIGGSAMAMAAKAGLLIAPLLSIGAAVNGARAALEEFGNVADNAAASGLDAEFFQGIAYQASLGGVAIDEISGALATFAKNSGLAAEGKGRMVTALKALDPVLLENIRKSTSQEARIRLVADALAKETDASRKAAIATAAFGDAGLKLANVFAGGAAQISEMQTKARDLGLIVDRDLIARADELGDEFDTTAKILDLRVKTALVNLGPLLVWLTDLTGDLALAASTVFDSFNGIGGRATSTLEAQLVALRESMSKPIGFGGTLQGVFDPAAVKAEIARIEAEIFRRADKASMGQLAGSTAPAGVDIPTLDEVGTRNDAAAAAIKQADAVKQLIANLEHERSLVGMSETDITVANALREAGAAATAEQRAQIEGLVRATAEEQEAVQRLNEIMGLLGDVGHTAVRGIVDALADGKVEASELNDILSDVLSQVGSFFLNQAFSGIGSLFGFSQGGAVGSFATGGYTGIGGKYAPAGIVHKGEYVFDAAAVRRIGVNNLERIRGFASGGYVGAVPLPEPRNDNTFAPVFNFAPVIQGGGGMSRLELDAALRDSEKRFRRELPRMIGDARRRGEM